MKKTLLLMVILMPLFFASCDGINKSNQNSDLERREAELKQREDSLREVELRQAEIQKEQDRIEAIEHEQKESETFSTSSGTFKVEDVLNFCYQKGVSNYNFFGNPDHDGFEPKWRTEEKFKDVWTHNFGIPNNEKAKAIFNQAYERYTQGWDDTANF